MLAMSPLTSLLPLLSLALLAHSTPLPPPVLTESGNGAAPWAGRGPKPDSQPTSAAAKVALASQAAADSAVPVGSIITSCTQPGVVALTFDDGPYIYTGSVLDTLKAAGVPATFFVNGDNWGSILAEENQALVRRMVEEGHQVGSHTWSHADLATLDRAGITSQLSLLEDALISIIGKFPAYFRPPYFSTNDLVLEVAGERSYHVINADIDTLDWDNDAEAEIGESVQRFKVGLDAGGTIELSHDVHQWTANVLVQAMVEEVRGRGLRAVTVGECLGDAQENWYRTR